MMNSMKNDFVNAYTWMYGSTKKEAEAAYRRAMEIANYVYVKEIINCFENNAKNAAYAD